MKHYLLSLLLLLTLPIRAQVGDLMRSTPESQGVPSHAVEAYFDSLVSLPTELHSCILMRHGKIIGEIHPSPFSPKDGHTVYSVSKTFTAAAIGIAISENRLRLSDRLAVFYPELLPDTISDRLASITLRDLLTMQSGFKTTDEVRNQQTEWIKGCLANKITSRPGTHFSYSSMDTYLLSAIITRVTGMSLLDYLRPRLFQPLHITDLVWESSPEDMTCGGWGLYLQAESMAKFGQLLLNRGNWKGRQLIPAGWVDEMMKLQVPGSNYGYQMWQCDNPGTARADGSFGQFIIVMPNEDMVAVITQSAYTAGVGAKERDLLFTQLVPSLSSIALPESKASLALQRKQATYSIPPIGGSATTKTRDIYDKTYFFPSHPLHWQSFRLIRRGQQLLFEIHTKDNGTVTLRCNNKSWGTSKVPVTFPPYTRSVTQGAFSGFTAPFTANSSYGWTKPTRLQIRTIFTNWMSGYYFTFNFDSSQLLYKTNYEGKWLRVNFQEKNPTAE